MEIAIYILAIIIIGHTALLIFILKYFLPRSGTHLNVRKSKRDDFSFYHHISFHHTSINSQEAAELVNKISSIISHITSKYNKYQPSQLEKELNSNN